MFLWFNGSCMGQTRHRIWRMSWPIQRHYSGTFIEGVRKTMENLTQDSRWFGGDENTVNDSVNTFPAGANAGNNTSLLLGSGSVNTPTNTRQQKTVFSVGSAMRPYKDKFQGSCCQKLREFRWRRVHLRKLSRKWVHTSQYTRVGWILIWWWCIYYETRFDYTLYLYAKRQGLHVLQTHTNCFLHPTPCALHNSFAGFCRFSTSGLLYNYHKVHANFHKPRTNTVE
jgi:hypothetical protein